jgi:hypothetical protein
MDASCEKRVVAAILAGSKAPDWLTPELFMVPLYAKIVGADLDLDSMNAEVAAHIQELAAIQMPSTYLEQDGRRLQRLARRRRALERVAVLKALLYEPYASDAEIDAAAAALAGVLNG